MKINAAKIKMVIHGAVMNQNWIVVKNKMRNQVAKSKIRLSKTKILNGVIWISNTLKINTFKTIWISNMDSDDS